MGQNNKNFPEVRYCVQALTFIMEPACFNLSLTGSVLYKQVVTTKDDFIFMSVLSFRFSWDWLASQPHAGFFLVFLVLNPKQFVLNSGLFF